MAKTFQRKDSATGLNAVRTRRRDILGGVTLLAGAASLPGAAPAAAREETSAAATASVGALYAWEKLIDELKPLGHRMLAKLPENLRDDPQAIADSMRLLLAGLARGANDALIGDRRHPVFVPETNVAFNLFQPNADTIYRAALIEPGATYRIKGERGTSRKFVLAQLGPDTLRTGVLTAALAQFDFDALKLDQKGNFDVILSAARPAGHTGDWWELHPKAEKLFVRLVGCDWGVEREPRFGIDRLDVAPSKGLVTAATLSGYFAELPTIAGNAACMFPDHVAQLRKEGFINKLKAVDFSNMTGLSRQSYYEGAYELAADEALIVEVKIPEKVGYWSLILTNNIYQTTDYYNNQSSLNDVQAHIDPDGVFRAVISARDPGTPNWLDTSGYSSGAVQGRWLEADDRPTPSVKKVKLSKVRAALPKKTPKVSPAEREAALRDRRIKAQMRALW